MARTIRIKLYQINELTTAAKNKAIAEHREFMRELDGRYSSTKEVLENIEINEYYFFEDGELAHCTTYTGGHEKSGTTEFHFHGKNYNITK